MLQQRLHLVQLYQAREDLGLVLGERLEPGGAGGGGEGSVCITIIISSSLAAGPPSGAAV